MKFTIIIPAYNSSKFINIPLDSLEKQTSQDFNVLIINDGSTDNLDKVTKPYIKRNKSWKVIDKKNGNWGSVMNYVKNKKLVKTEYVTILDSDDFFSPNMIEEVSKRTEDVIITGINKLENGKAKKLPIFFSNTGTIKKDRAYTPVSTPHGKFYKTSLWNKMIDLEEGVSYQDTVLFNDLISKSKSIYFIKTPLATWWIDREGNSTTVAWDEKRAALWIKTCTLITNLKNGHDETNSWAIMYLWELNRQYGKPTNNKVKINTKKAKFKWLPFGVRNISKMYFLLKTRKYRTKM